MDVDRRHPEIAYLTEFITFSRYFMSHSPFNEIWAKAEHIPSPFFPKDHARILFEAASAIPGTVVEIGSWHGRSSVILGSAIKNSTSRLYCIDHWNLFESVECIMECNIWEEWNNNIVEWHLTDVVIPIRMVSSEAAGQWLANQHIDLLFIDGIHSYKETGPLVLSKEVIKEYSIKGWKKNGTLIPAEAHTPCYDRGAKVDFDLWAGKIKPGGLLIMHDVEPGHPGVLKVWQEEIEPSNEWTVLETQKGLGVAQKGPI